MTYAEKAITNAPRSQYYGREVPWYFHLSYKIQCQVERLARLLERQRKAMVRHTMKEMWKVGQRVKTQYGLATVVKNTTYYNTFGMGGFIQTDVRYDTPPEPGLQNGKTDQYPYIGHYNQIFLEDV